MKPTLLIDIDGTIADSLPSIKEAFLVAMSAINHPIPSQAFLDQLPGPPMKQSMAKLGLSDAEVTAAFDAYMTHQRQGSWLKMEMFPGWPEVLGTWREAGFRLATATSKGEFFVNKTLEHFGILEDFDFIGAADDNGTRHEKIDVISYTLDSLGIARDGNGNVPPGVVMIGDRIHDFAGAAAFGIPSIAVEWGYGDSAERAQADRIVSDWQSLDYAARELLYL